MQDYFPTVEQIQSNSSNHAWIHRNARKHQIIQDHLTKLCKLVSNENIPVKTRMDKLYALGKKYGDGYPFKNNAILSSYRVDGFPVLARTAIAMAEQLFKIEQVRTDDTLNLGKGENAE